MTDKKKIVSLQRAGAIDNMRADGTPMYQQPYPIHVDADGNVCQQDLWQGKIFRVVGFQRDVRKQQVDVWWREVWADPDKAVGLYMVTQDKDGQMVGWQTGVESVRIGEVSSDF